MSKYSKTAIAFFRLKETLLYFDYVVPVNLSVEMVQESGDFNPLPPGLVEQFLPPGLRKDSGFRERLADVNFTTMHVFAKLAIKLFGVPPGIPGLSDVEYASIDEKGESNFSYFLNEFGLGALPVDCTSNLVSEVDADQGDVAITLPSLQLIDTERCSLEQIVEFRRDAATRDKLRRLRLFAYENYSGKSKQYIEDDILKRVSDYDEAVKRWGFETTHGALSMLLNSKMLAGALGGSLVSTLFGAPAVAVATAVGGVSLEIGRIALEVGRQQFALRKLMTENPVSYISHARSILEGKGARLN